MKKILLLVAAVFIAVSSFAQEGVKWETGTFQDALNKAKNNKKGPNLVFMDCYTTWCGPCKHMANVVFPTKEAGDYFNKKFVNFKTDMEKGEGIELAKKYNVRAYPTFLILDGDGNEVGRVVGSAELGKFIENVEAACDPAKSPKALLEKYNASKDGKDLMAYLDALNAAYKKDEIAKFISDNFNDIPTRTKYSRDFWKHCKGAISVKDSRVLDAILASKTSFDSIYGKDELDKVIYGNLFSNLTSFLQGRTELTPEQVDKACLLISLLTDGSAYETTIMRAAKAYATKDMKEVAKALSGRSLSYSHTGSQIYVIQRIVLGMKDLPDADKAKFLKDYKKSLESNVKSVEKALEPYKDVEIADNGNKPAEMAAIRTN